MSQGIGADGTDVPRAASICHHASVAGPALIHEPAEMSPEWLTEVLRPSFPEAEVTAVAGVPVGTGLMARSVRLTLTGSGVPASVVAKVPSGDAATRELGATAYLREVGFYRDIAPRISAKVPACHHADVSESAQEFVLILEDITPASQGDQIAGCSVAEAGAAIDNMAQLHASTWGDDTIAELDWLGDRSGMSLSDYMPIALAAFEPRFEGLLTDDTWAVLRGFTERATEWQEAEPATRAAVHGDFRLDNLLFSATDGAVTAVDWQTINYVSPGRDVAYFLGNSLTTEDRRVHEEALFERYLDVLRSSGVAYTDEQFHTDLRYGMFQGPLVTMLGAFTAIQTERSEPMFAAMANRCAAQILDHGAMDIL